MYTLESPYTAQIATQGPTPDSGSPTITHCSGIMCMYRYVLYELSNIGIEQVGCVGCECMRVRVCVCAGACVCAHV